MLHYENLLYLRLGLKLKKIHLVLEFNQPQWLKSYIEFNLQERIKAEKKRHRKAIYRKAMENLRNKINVRLVNNEKDYLKGTSKPSYISHKTFDNNLVAIRKVKVTLTFNKLAYIGMDILDFSKSSIMITSKINMAANQNYFYRH